MEESVLAESAVWVAEAVMALCPGPTETRFFETANPTKPFLTRGRQSPADVAAFALAKFERRRRPSVVPGVGNRLQATGYRFMSRSLVARVGERVLSAA